MAPTIFKAAARERIEVQVGDEIVDLSTLPMGVLLDVIALLGDDPGNVSSSDLGNVIEAMAVICQASNKRVTKDYLLGLDAFEEVMPFMKFALGVVREKMATANGGVLKNEESSSS